MLNIKTKELPGSLAFLALVIWPGALVASEFDLSVNIRVEIQLSEIRKVWNWDEIEIKDFHGKLGSLLEHFLS